MPESDGDSGSLWDCERIPRSKQHHSIRTGTTTEDLIEERYRKNNNKDLTIRTKPLPTPLKN